MRNIFQNPKRRMNSKKLIDMIKRVVIVSVVIVILTGLAASIPKDPQFWKGNMHTHSYWSDGDTYPEEVAYWYKSNGYNFLAVTDHNILQEGTKWFHVDRNSDTRENYEAYLEHFGGVGLESQTRDNGLWVKLRTLDDYRDEFEVENEFILISSEEVTDASEKKPVHLGAIHTNRLISPTKGTTIAECLKANVDEMRSQLSHSGNPEWIIVNHPNFGWALTAEDIAYSGARFFELFNGHPSVNNYGNEELPGTELLWDHANIIRLSKGQQLLFGVANDDSHNYLEFNTTKANPGRGWTMVKSSELSPESLYKSMLTGDFYATTGVVLNNFRANSRQLQIEISAEKGVTYHTEFIALNKGDSETKIVATETGTRPKYKFSGNELFVRARIVSSKIKENPFKEGDTETAWIQPIKVN